MPASTPFYARRRRRASSPLLFHAVLVGAAVLGAGIAVAPASARPATAEGARALTDAMAGFMGRAPFDKGLITITPQGEAYDLHLEIDSGKLGLAPDGPDIHVGPFDIQLTPQDDGTYAAVSRQSPLVLSFKSGKDAPPVVFEERLDGCTSNGVFDPNLAIFSSYTTNCDSQSVTVRAPLQDVDATHGKLSMQSHAERGANGAVDVHMTADLADIVETITPRNPVRPEPPMVLRADNIHEDVVTKGLVADKILHIVALLAAKGTQAEIAAAQDDMKAKVLAALPLWQDMSIDIRLNAFSMGTPVGIVRAATVDEKVASTGLVKDARYGVGLRFSGLELPSGLVPDWAKPFVPTDGGMNLDLSGIDLDAMARLVVQRFDATRHPPLPDDMRATLVGMFEAGKPRIHFTQDLTAAALDAKGQGATSVAPAQQGTATVSAGGLDQLIAALGQAPMPNKQRALLGLAFIKGLAKTGPDGRSVWDIAFDSLARKITVNGQSFGPGKPK